MPPKNHSGLHLGKYGIVILDLQNLGTSLFHYLNTMMGTASSIINYFILHDIIALYGCIALSLSSFTSPWFRVAHIRNLSTCHIILSFYQTLPTISVNDSFGDSINELCEIVAATPEFESSNVTLLFILLWMRIT